MVLKLQRTSKDFVELELEDEDISIADVLQYEALKDEHIAFAGVVAPHPLQRKAVLKVRTDGADASAALKRASKKSLTKIKEMISRLEETGNGD